MSNLFIKYLAVEGDIKAGDILSEYWKVLPHLCSRDIQVGDKVSSLLTDCSYFTTATKEHIESNKRVDNNNEYFKVLGLISPDATWVEDGMEVKEEDVIYYGPFEDDNFSPAHSKLRCPTCKHFH